MEIVIVIDKQFASRINSSQNLYTIGVYPIGFKKTDLYTDASKFKSEKIPQKLAQKMSKLYPKSEVKVIKNFGTEEEQILWKS